MRQVLLFWILCYVTPIYGTAILWTEDNGLNDNEITAIAKDRSGLMWIGTAKGLNAFDGYSFINQEPFTGKHINSLVYDSVFDHLWICSDEGLWRMSCNDRSVTDYTAACRDKNVCTVLLLGGRTYIVFTNCTILELDAANHVSVVFFNPYRHQAKTVSPKDVISNGQKMIYVHIAGTRSIYTIHTGTHAVTITSDSLFRPLMTFLFRRDSTVYISSRDKIIPYGGRADRQFVDSRNSVHVIHDFLKPFPQGDRYFVSSRFSGSIFLLDARTLESEPVTEKLSSLLLGKARTVVFPDDRNMAWIGTKRGLIRYVHPAGDRRFEAIRLPGPKNISTRAILRKDTSTLYIASYAGLITYNIRTGVSAMLNNHPCRELFRSGNRLYIGSESNNALMVMDIPSERILSGIRIITDSIPVNEVFSIAEDAGRTLLLGTGNGLIFYDRDKNTFRRDHHEALRDVSVFSIAARPDKEHFWIGTSNGLFLWRSGKGITQTFTKSTTPALSSNEVTFVQQDPSGKVFICTRSGGVNILSADMKEISWITKAEGLSHNETYGIIPCGDSTCWISTYNGLCCYDTRSGRSVNFYREDGLPENEFNQNSLLKVSEDELYFGSINGVVKVNPSAAGRSAVPFSIYASSVNKWDPGAKRFRPLSPREENIELRAGENLFNLTLGGTDYRFPERSRFYYRVEELSGNWIMLPPYLPALRLEGLQPGVYHISIKAFNASGQASENTLTYTLKIGQYFYKTAWFYLLLMVLLGLCVYIYFAWRIRRIRAIHELRTAIASNLHDEIGSLLTQITMWSDSLRLRPKDFENKTRVLEMISSLSREVNSNISDVLWAIDSRNDLGGSFTERLKDHTDGLLESRDIDFFVHSDESTGTYRMSPDERQQLFLIYKEALNNILKHSKADRISIVFRTGNAMELTVTNNGVTGFAAEKTSGQGLKNMEMRARKIGARFVYRSSGEEFTVSVYKK